MNVEITESERSDLYGALTTRIEFLNNTADNIELETQDLGKANRLRDLVARLHKLRAKFQNPF